MKTSAGRDSNWHPGSQIASIPVVGVGVLIFAVGAVLTLFGMPEGKWFFDCVSTSGRCGLASHQAGAQAAP